MTEQMVLSDAEAVRLLALAAAHDGVLPDPAVQQQTEVRLEEAAAEVTADFGETVSDGDLARAALDYLATVPGRASGVAGADGSVRFDPAALLVGVLVVTVLRDDVELGPGRDGRWTLHVRKEAVRDAGLVALVGKVLSYYRQSRS